MKEYQIRGYDPAKKIFIDLIICMLREAIPVFGAVIIMSAAVSAVLCLVEFNIIALLLSSIPALFILIFVCHLIAKVTSVRADRAYGKQELYLIGNDLYHTADIRTRFSRKIKCFKIIEIYRIEKSKLYWELDCLCYKTEKFCYAAENIEAALEKLIQDKEALKPGKESLIIKRQYGDQSDELIDGIFEKIAVKESFVKM